MDEVDGLVDDLLIRAAAGDESARASLFDLHRGKLLRMVRLRLDRRLWGRIGAEDVLQEAYIDFSRELPGYLRSPKISFFIWLRLLAAQRLMRIHRQHLGAAMRDAGREVALDREPESNSVALAGRLVGRLTTASQAFARAERREMVRAALETMDPTDREVIALRHFEGLGNNEAAEILGLTKAAASNRYVRAMGRFQEALSRVPGLVDRP